MRCVVVRSQPRGSNLSLALEQCVVSRPDALGQLVWADNISQVPLLWRIAPPLTTHPSLPQLQGRAGLIADWNESAKG